MSFTIGHCLPFDCQENKNRERLRTPEIEMRNRYLFVTIAHAITSGQCWATLLHHNMGEDQIETVSRQQVAIWVHLLTSGSQQRLGPHSDPPAAKILTLLPAACHPAATFTNMVRTRPEGPECWLCMTQASVQKWEILATIHTPISQAAFCQWKSHGSNLSPWCLHFLQRLVNRHLNSR